MQHTIQENVAMRHGIARTSAVWYEIKAIHNLTEDNMASPREENHHPDRNTAMNATWNVAWNTFLHAWIATKDFRMGLLATLICFVLALFLAMLTAPLFQITP
jgi:hypothetical protein